MRIQIILPFFLSFPAPKNQFPFTDFIKQYPLHIQASEEKLHNSFFLPSPFSPLVKFYNQKSFPNQKKRLLFYNATRENENIWKKSIINCFIKLFLIREIENKCLPGLHTHAHILLSLKLELGRGKYQCRASCFKDISDQWGWVRGTRERSIIIFLSSHPF